MNREQRKADSHDRILRSASRLLRQRGIQGATVGKVMARAGLTVGGFYAHFRSKRALVAGAFREAGQEARSFMLDGLDELGPRAWLRAIVGRYVTEEHRDTDPPRCALPATLSEVARAGRAEREAYVDACARLLGLLEPRAAELGGSAAQAREKAVALLVVCVGGVALARATRGTALSDEILTASRHLGESLAR
jgi:TetR/AcrR family transcriptional regulator, transcriptional repressor for nem operon